MLTRLCLWLDKRVFPIETLQDKITKQLEESVTEVEIANAAIHNYQFQLHMNKAKIKALNEWLLLFDP